MSDDDHHGLPPLPVFYSIAEAARVLRLGKSTLYRLVERGELKLSKVGGIRNVVHRDELEKLIQVSEPAPRKPRKPAS